MFLIFQVVFLILCGKLNFVLPADVSRRCNNMECVIVIDNPPYTDCDDPSWIGVTFTFGRSVFSKQMSEVCQKGMSKSFKIYITVNDYVATRSGSNMNLILQKNLSMNVYSGKQWSVDTISFECRLFPNTKFYLRFGRKIESGRLYSFYNYDTFLEPSGFLVDQVEQELSDAIEIYQQTNLFGSGPPMLSELSKEDLYSYTVLQAMKQNAVNSSIEALQSRLANIENEQLQFHSLEEMEDFFNGALPGFPKVEGLPNWKEDGWFANLRIFGSSWRQITFIEEIDENFKINDTRIRMITGNSAAELLNKSLLFMTNLDLLKDFPNEIWAPMALFYINDTRSFRKYNELDPSAQLLPIAIQLERNVTAADVFYSDDPQYSWLLAKIFYNCADAVHHVTALELARNHVFLDMAFIAIFHTFPPTHPVYKLMKPFTDGMFGNNMFTLKNFLKNGGVLDGIMTGNSTLALKLVNAEINNMDYDKFTGQCSFSAKLKNRRIPKYTLHERKTVQTCFKIRLYILDMLSSYYGNVTANINPYSINPIDDPKVKEFRLMFSESESSNKIRMKGMPGSERTGEMSLFYFADFLTSLLFRASYEKSGYGNSYYERSALITSYPLKLKKAPIKPSDAVTEQTILDALPNKREAIHLAQFITSLSFNYGSNVSYPEKPILLSLKDKKANKRFFAQIKNLEDLKKELLNYEMEFALFRLMNSYYYRNYVPRNPNLVREME